MHKQNTQKQNHAYEQTKKRKAKQTQTKQNEKANAKHK